MYIRTLKINEKRSVFLFGPRGTGKSSWVKSNYPDALYIDLLDSEIFAELTANPKRIESFILPSTKKTIIIDEIQKIPQLLNEVHRLIEEKKIRFILTGSSARKLRKQGVNLLAGRALTYYLHPLTAQELKQEFQVERALQSGLLPMAYNHEEPGGFLASYVNTYIREEVQQEALTRNMNSFYRFLETISFSQGSILNISAIARECGIERKVIENYISILEDLLIAHRILPFTKKAQRRLTLHPKFFFFDVGIFRAIRPKGPLDSPEEIEGIALETLVYQHLRAINDYYNFGYSIYYWRSSTGLEVDFVLYGEKGLHIFEVKRSGKVKPEYLKGLRAFLRDYHIAKAYLIYSGEFRRVEEPNIVILPAKIFFSQLHEFLL